MCMVNINFACEAVTALQAEIGTYMLETEPMAAKVSESCWQMLQCYKPF